MALIMVMGRALLVYALGERHLRQALAAEKETIPNQVGKPTRRPTFRRVFPMFAGIDLLLMVADGQIIDWRVLHLTPVRLKIIALLGPAVKMCYLCDV